MELTEFLEAFSSLFDDTDLSEITASTKFRELDEWSSLLVMGIIAMARTKYGTTVTGSSIKSCETVEDLFHLVTNR